ARRSGPRGALCSRCRALRIARRTQRRLRRPLDALNVGPQHAERPLELSHALLERRGTERAALLAPGRSCGKPCVKARHIALERFDPFLESRLVVLAGSRLL